MAHLSTLESDEAFARRLQAQELGLLRIAPATANNNSNVDAQTPLMRTRPAPTGGGPGNAAQGGNNNSNNNNPNVINARMNEITSSWATVGIISVTNLPQVLATIIVLSVHWNTDHTCDRPHMFRWKLWAVIAAARMLIYTGVIFYLQFYRTHLQERPEQWNKWRSIANTLDGCGLIWFVLGNLWLFGDDASNACSHPEKSPIYDMCLSMLIVNYIQFCLPCIIAIILIPVFCFCTPCLIRLLARLNDPRNAQGATQNIIDSIPLVTVSADTFAEGQESTCPICISEMTLGESVRSLRCQHIFHQQCVDEWLRVNGSCPLCRKNINDDTNNSHNHESEERSNSSDALMMVPLNPASTSNNANTQGNSLLAAHHR